MRKILKLLLEFILIFKIIKMLKILSLAIQNVITFTKFYIRRFDRKASIFVSC